MTSDPDTVAQTYDNKYRRANYFEYRDWWYYSYLKAVVTRAGLRRGASVLDAGCGQGFFTALFDRLGFDAVGVDLSGEGIAAAKARYQGTGTRFMVGDVTDLPFRGEFDLVFTRSCSLYNTEDFGLDDAVTQRMLEYVKPGGVFIFDYYTKLKSGKRSDTWLYHSARDMERHFAAFRNCRMYFCLRFDALLLGALILTRPWSEVAQSLSRLSGLGGELVAIVRKD